jgi:hydrogenase maturation protease
MNRILVAGVGNLFFGDDAFGVEVAHRLATAAPPDTRVIDFGIRMIHLTYELLEPVELCIVADCVERGSPPGTLYVIEPEIDATAEATSATHEMSLPAVFAAVRSLGGTVPRTLVVGCEPEATEPIIGLSASVTRAIPGAIEIIRDLVLSTKGAAPCTTTISAESS